MWIRAKRRTKKMELKDKYGNIIRAGDILRVNPETETTCPICKAKCTITTSQHCHLCNINKNYYPLPQPDLTKLREVYDRYGPTPKWWTGELAVELWWAIKEVLDAETSDSEHKR